MRKLFELAVKIAGFWFVLSLISFVPVNVSKTEAGGLVVTTTADSGGGSFRDAWDTAVASPGGDTITFDPTVFPPGSPATIHATATYVAEAPGASDPLTIDANGAGVIFDFTGVTEGAAAFHFRPDGGDINGVTFKNFTIQNFTSDTNHEGHGIEIGNNPASVSNLDIESMTITGMSADGLFLNAGDNFSAIIEGNTISDNDGVGIHISADTTSNLFITSNEIADNGSKGIDLDVTNPDVSSTAQIAQNTVSGNSNDGIFIAGPESTNAIHATITQNSTFNNGGLGINLLGFGNEFDGVTENDPGDTDMGANDLLNFPVLNLVANGIVGTACANCIIEIFISDNDPTGHGEGKTYLGSGTADADGNFDVEVCVGANASVTATATDFLGNTSEFSLNYTVPFATCDSNFIQGDLDCDGDVDGRDALLAFVFNSGSMLLSQELGCPVIGQNNQPVSVGTQGGDLFGDVDCSGSVDTTDGLLILQYLAEVDLNPNPPIDCTPIGQTIGAT